MVFRLVVAFAAFLVAGVVRAADGPRTVIETFHETLLGVMKRADELGIEGRYRILEPHVERTLDLQHMIRVAAGSQWSKATPEEREALFAAFSRLSVGTYAARFDGYQGERFETLGERPGPREAVLVDTRIVKSDGSSVALTYVMKQTGDHWQVVDVLLDGSVSELAMRRSEYRALGGGTADGLANKLDAKADELLAGR